MGRLQLTRFTDFAVLWVLVLMSLRTGEGAGLLARDLGAGTGDPPANVRGDGGDVWHKRSLQQQTQGKADATCGNFEASGGPPGAAPRPAHRSACRRSQMEYLTPHSRLGRQVSVTYLVGSTALLPKPGATPAPAPSPLPDSDLLGGLFALFTIQNNRSQPIDGWQLVWSFRDAGDLEIANFKGALPLAVPGTSQVRAVNTVRRTFGRRTLPGAAGDCLVRAAPRCPAARLPRCCAGPCWHADERQSCSCSLRSRARPGP